MRCWKIKPLAYMNVGHTCTGNGAGKSLNKLRVNTVPD